MMGLLYAFYVAGNQNTVMTLWKVINKSTAGFTKSFFESFVLSNGNFLGRRLKVDRINCLDSWHAEMLIVED